MAMDTQGQEFSAWAFPALLCEIWSTSNPQCLEGDRKEMDRRAMRARRPREQLKALKTISRENFKKPKCLKVVIPTFVEDEEELLLVYGGTPCCI